MNIAWIVIANSSKATIYSLTLDQHKKTCVLVKTFDNPKSRFKISDLAQDQVGQYGYGTGGHATYSHNDLHENVVEEFALEVAKYIDSERANNQFQKLFIIAEPMFLGMLLGNLSILTQNLVKAKIDKNYVHALDNKELTIENIVGMLDKHVLYSDINL
ncbi:MAG: host attachment protein [Neisseriaceae bacterium]|jgi:protein required for attachment to host cells